MPRWLDNIRKSHSNELQNIGGQLHATPDKWGPPTWRFLHYSANAYSPRKKASWRSLLRSLPTLIPCEECSKNLRKSMKGVNLTGVLRSRKSLVRFMYLLHEHVKSHSRKRRRSRSKSRARSRNRRSVKFSARQYNRAYS